MIRPSCSIPSGLGAATLAFLLAWPGPAAADKIKHPTAVFAGLDKITGRIIAFDVAIDETVQFGTLQVTPRVCYTRPATEAPLTTGFVEVDEVTSSNEFKRIFAGWMFAASPGLHGVEHPVYDAWLTDCKGGSEVIRDVAVPQDVPPPAPASPAARRDRPVRPVRPVTPGAVTSLPNATALPVPNRVPPAPNPASQGPAGVIQVPPPAPAQRVPQGLLPPANIPNALPRRAPAGPPISDPSDPFRDQR